MRVCRACDTLAPDIGPRLLSAPQHVSRHQTPQNVLSCSWPRPFAIATDDSRLWIKRAFHLFVCRPPVGSLDLSNAIADKRFRRLDVVQFTRVLTQKFRLI